MAPHRQHDGRRVLALLNQAEAYNIGMSPKRLPRIAIIVIAFASLAGAQSRTTSIPMMDVYKTPTCGCCSKWVDHMRAAKFQARVTDMKQAELDKIKAKHGIPVRFHSCHTALVGGYIVEGHIPAAEVKRLLKEKPAVAGIAVPGMPIGSPGMEVPGSRPRPYDVLAFDKQGRAQVFATVKP